MVSIGMFGLLFVVGLAGMAAIAAFVSAGRKYLEPEKPESYYAGVGGIIIVVSLAALYLTWPPATAPELLASYGGWFGIMLAALYCALAIYHARSDGTTQQASAEEQPKRDRPLSR